MLFIPLLPPLFLGCKPQTVFYPNKGRLLCSYIVLTPKSNHQSRPVLPCVSLVGLNGTMNKPLERGGSRGLLASSRYAAIYAIAGY